MNNCRRSMASIAHRWKHLVTKMQRYLTVDSCQQRLMAGSEHLLQEADPPHHQSSKVQLEMADKNGPIKKNNKKTYLAWFRMNLLLELNLAFSFNQCRVSSFIWLLSIKINCSTCTQNDYGRCLVLRLLLVTTYFLQHHNSQSLMIIFVHWT